MHVVHTAIFPPICLDLCGHSLKKKKKEQQQQKTLKKSRHGEDSYCKRKDRLKSLETQKRQYSESKRKHCHFIY